MDGQNPSLRPYPTISSKSKTEIWLRTPSFSLSNMMSQPRIKSQCRCRRVVSPFKCSRNKKPTEGTKLMSDLQSKVDVTIAVRSFDSCCHHVMEMNFTITNLAATVDTHWMVPYHSTAKQPKKWMVKIQVDVRIQQYRRSLNQRWSGVGLLSSCCQILTSQSIKKSTLRLLTRTGWYSVTQSKMTITIMKQLGGRQMETTEFQSGSLYNNLWKEHKKCGKVHKNTLHSISWYFIQSLLHDRVIADEWLSTSTWYMLMIAHQLAIQNARGGQWHQTNKYLQYPTGICCSRTNPVGMSSMNSSFIWFVMCIQIWKVNGRAGANLCWRALKQSEYYCTIQNSLLHPFPRGAKFSTGALSSRRHYGYNEVIYR